MKVDFNTYSSNQPSFKWVKTPSRQEIIEYFGDKAGADIYQSAKPGLEKLSRKLGVNIEFRIPQEEAIPDIETRALDIFVNNKRMYCKGYPLLSMDFNTPNDNSIIDYCAEHFKSLIEKSIRAQLNLRGKL